MQIIYEFLEMKMTIKNDIFITIKRKSARQKYVEVQQFRKLLFVR